MDYMSTLEYLTNIEHNLYHSIIDSKFIQTKELVTLTSWFKYDKKPKKQLSIVMYHNTLHELFFMLIDPIQKTADMITKMNSLLDTHKDLLKTITHHYKKLASVIVSYLSATSTDDDDTSYTNEKYISFWCNIMNSNIYIIQNTSYTKYEPSDVSNTDIIIKVCDGKFEYINANFNEYMIKHNLHPSIDVSKLHTYTIDHLKKICTNCRIQVEPKIKKPELIRMLQQVLI